MFSNQESPINYASTYTEQDSLYAEHLKSIDRFHRCSPAKLSHLLLPFESRLLTRICLNTACSSLIDLGCGTGRFLRAAKNEFSDSRGYEFADVLVQKLNGYGMRVRQGGIEDFLASQDRADAISLLEVVEHLTEPGKLIGAIFEQKSPQLLAVVVPAWDTRRRYDKRFTEHDCPPNHLSWWDEKSLRTLLGQSGYRVTIESIAETRLNLLKYLIRNFRVANDSATYLEWVHAFIAPPTYWLLGIAERVDENKSRL